MTEFENLKAIYYLESISRNLAEYASVVDDIPLPSIGSGALADNRDWLSNYIEHLKTATTQ